MTQFIKITNGVVVQKQPYFEDGFVEVDDAVMCGMLFDGVKFTNPVPAPSEALAPVTILRQAMFEDFVDRAIKNTTTPKAIKDAAIAYKAESTRG